MQDRTKLQRHQQERIKHFNEFHTPLSKEEQEIQGAQMYGHVEFRSASPAKI